MMNQRCRAGAVLVLGSIISSRVMTFPSSFLPGADVKTESTKIISFTLALNLRYAFTFMLKAGIGLSKSAAFIG